MTAATGRSDTPTPSDRTDDPVPITRAAPPGGESITTGRRESTAAGPAATERTGSPESTGPETDQRPVVPKSEEHKTGYRDPSMWNRVEKLVGFIGPTTVLTALLFYFGYVATRARFLYFGVALDLLDLSTQDILLYGVEALYVPVTALFLALLVAVTGHAMIGGLLALEHRGIVGWLGVATLLASVLLLARAVIGIVLPRISEAEFPGVTPLCLTIGAALFGYGLWLLRRVGLLWAEQAEDRRRRAIRNWLGSRSVVFLWRLIGVAVSALMIAGLFWATNSFANAYGKGRGHEDAQGLPERPAVLLYTSERIVDLPPGVTETQLPAEDEALVRYRYDGLRLLLESEGRLFLVPSHWTDDSACLVIPYEGVSLRTDP